MTIDPTTATLDECRDWLAIHKRPGGHRYDEFTKTHFWKKRISNDWTREHPIPETLDAAAEAMPSGWWWEVWVDSLPGVQVKAIPLPPNIDQPHIYIDQSETEILARFRLAVACCQADDERKEKA